AAKDRHAPVGSGYIGFQAIHTIVRHEVAKDKPIILETPWIGKDKNNQRPMYEADIALLSVRAEERFGPEFLEHVVRIKHLQANPSLANKEGSLDVMQTRDVLLVKKSLAHAKPGPLE